MVFYFINVPSTHSLDLLHKMVVENGGTFSMNLNNSVTHCIAAENRGIKFQAAKLRGDVIHYSWLLDCSLQKKLLPLQPKYFLYLSEPSKRKLQEEIDENSDSYFVDIDAADIRQLLNNIGGTQHSVRVDHYKKKYCPKDKWAHLQDCYFYFKLSPQALMNSEWKILLELALRRMKVAVSFGGGTVTDDLSNATHVIVLSAPGVSVDFNLLLCCLQEAEKHVIISRRTHVLASQWVEDCIEKEQKVSQEFYSLKPVNVQNFVFQERDRNEINLDTRPGLDGDGLSTSSSAIDGSSRSRGSATKPRLATLPKKEREMKRGRPSGTGGNRVKALTSHPRRVRARIGNKPPEINENESDGTVSPDRLSFPEETEIRTGNVEGHKMADKNRPETQENQLISKDFEVSKGKAVEPETLEPKQASEAHGIYSGSRNGAEEHDMLENVTADPVQAILQSMIPSLGTSRASSQYHITKDEKLPEIVQSKDSASLAEGAVLDPGQKTEKKRKVSYKDVAGELLKDW